MTLRTVWRKLKKRNRGDYRQFEFCVTFAVMLISSFLMLVCSPLIQGALPEGGDSRKQVWLIFGVAAIGCMIFTLYVTKLFLRYKSREIGIFMALGARKRMLGNALAGELMRMTAVDAVLGILAGAALAFGAGTFVEAAVSEVYDGTFAYTGQGFLLSAGYAAFLFLMIQFQARRSMKRTNIMEIIYEQRRQEPMKKSVSKGYLASGIVLTAIGIFGGLFLTGILVYTLGFYPGSWTNGFYLLAVLGLYRVLVYVVSSHQRGRNPQKYYRNLIDYGMLKFQGASVVRNMLVITLLLFGGMYAISYVPTRLVSNGEGREYEAEYSYRYLRDADVPSEAEITALAEEYGITVQNYREVAFLRVFGSGVERDMGEDNRLMEDYYDRYARYDVTSQSEYEKATGIRLDVSQGEYYQINGSASYENLWFHYGDMDQLYVEREDAFLPMRCQGTTFYEALNINGNGMGAQARFVVSDQDYARLAADLPKKDQEVSVLFDTEGEKKQEIAFSNAVFRELAKRMSPGMDVLAYYNEAEAEREGESYIRDFTGAVVDPENPLKETDWQFAPLLTPLTDQQLLMQLVTRILMFTYVFLICLAAVGVIGYTRSQSVGLTNRQVFEDIRRLGADQSYQRALLRKQIRRIFLIPTALGVGVCLLYQTLTMWNNDYRMLEGEVKAILALAAIGAVIVLYQCALYRASVCRVRKLVGLE